MSSCYHEMLVHPALMTHPHPGRVLIIGGGDGGTLRRVLQHRQTRPTQVEIDEVVVRASREYLPQISAGAYDDPRTELIIGDGVQYMRDNPGQFDIIIVDSTDPVGPAVELFRAPFYKDVARSLTEDGLLVAQSNSPLLMQDELRSQVANLARGVPPRAHLYRRGLWLSRRNVELVDWLQAPRSGDRGHRADCAASHGRWHRHALLHARGASGRLRAPAVHRRDRSLASEIATAPSAFSGGR